MAKVHLDRLREKYGWTGGKYRDLIKRIIATNRDNLARGMARMSKRDFEKAQRKVSTQEKRFVVPDEGDVVPKRAAHVRKAAINGQKITDTLRDRLTKNLRDRMREFTPQTGEATYLTRRGSRAGRVNPKLVDKFQKDIRKTFESYTKRNPEYDMPSNIRNIAVTEFRSTVDEVKYQYMVKLQEKNPDFEIRKRWIHNKRLSAEPRDNHEAMEGVTVRFDEPFMVPSERRGKIAMRYPHDSQAPEEEVIGCHCDFDVLVRRLTRGRTGA